ncbi:MAG: transposase [Deltaproteobacteria bacterium]|nr:MAG: transposase [Deltaproteobacteria bacterium]
MHIDKLRDSFPDDNVCRQFLESVIWAGCRLCPGCRYDKSYAIRGKTARAGLY